MINKQSWWKTVGIARGPDRRAKWTCRETSLWKRNETVVGHVSPEFRRTHTPSHSLGPESPRRLEGTGMPWTAQSTSDISWWQPFPLPLVVCELRQRRKILLRCWWLSHPKPRYEISGPSPDTSVILRPSISKNSYAESFIAAREETGIIIITRTYTIRYFLCFSMFFWFVCIVFFIMLLLLSGE